jgi:ATP synthase subunit 6
MLFQVYRFVLNILETQVGKKAQKFFPYVFAIFIIILIANLTGMIFYAFTLTSHIMVTFTLGISSFIGLTILGFSTQKLSFLNLFLPKGIPAALVPILVVVEIISYTSRALSLSIRLFANLMSGHTLLHILAFFASKICKISYIVASLGFLLIIAIIMLELCIAMLQAYVFTILICIYLNDSINPADH